MVKCLRCSAEYDDNTERCDACDFEIQGETIDGVLFDSYFMQLVRTSNDFGQGKVYYTQLLDVVANYESYLASIFSRLEQDRDTFYETYPDALDEVKNVFENVINQMVESAAHFQVAFTGIRSLGAILNESLSMAEKGHDYMKLAKEIAVYSEEEIEKVLDRAEKGELKPGGEPAEDGGESAEAEKEPDKDAGEEEKK